MANEAEGGVRRNVRPEEGLARVYKPNEKACPNRGRTLSVTNMRRHHKGCRMLQRGGEKCVYGRATPIKVKFMYCLDCLKLRKRIFSLSSTEEYLVINMDHF